MILFPGITVYQSELRSSGFNNSLRSQLAYLRRHCTAVYLKKIRNSLSVVWYRETVASVKLCLREQECHYFFTGGALGYDLYFFIKL